MGKIPPIKDIPFLGERKMVVFEKYQDDLKTK
jgi:hypothetical protein